jgi:hypothetical protein
LADENSGASTTQPVSSRMLSNAVDHDQPHRLVCPPLRHKHPRSHTMITPRQLPESCCRGPRRRPTPRTHTRSGTRDARRQTAFQGSTSTVRAHTHCDVRDQQRRAVAGGDEACREDTAALCGPPQVRHGGRLGRSDAPVTRLVTCAHNARNAHNATPQHDTPHGTMESHVQTRRRAPASKRASERQQARAVRTAPGVSAAPMQAHGRRSSWPRGACRTGRAALCTRGCGPRHSARSRLS